MNCTCIWHIRNANLSIRLRDHLYTLIISLNIYKIVRTKIINYGSDIELFEASRGIKPRLRTSKARVLNHYTIRPIIHNTYYRTIYFLF